MKSTEIMAERERGRFPIFGEEAELQTAPRWERRRPSPPGQVEGQLGQLPGKRQSQAPRSPGGAPGGERARAQGHHSNGGGQAFRGGASSAHRARASSSPIRAAGLPGPRWKGKRKSSLLPRLPELTRITLTGLEVSPMLLLFSPAQPPHHRVGAERVEGPSPFDTLARRLRGRHPLLPAACRHFRLSSGSGTGSFNLPPRRRSGRMGAQVPPLPEGSRRPLSPHPPPCLAGAWLTSRGSRGAPQKRGSPCVGRLPVSRRRLG